jgi:hypothetical protein
MRKKVDEKKSHVQLKKKKTPHKTHKLRQPELPW